MTYTHMCTSTHLHTCTHSLVFIFWRHKDAKDINIHGERVATAGPMLPWQHSVRLSGGDQPGSMAAPPAVLEVLGISRVEDSLRASLPVYFLTADQQGRHQHTSFRDELEAQTRF